MFKQAHEKISIGRGETRTHSSALCLEKEISITKKVVFG